MIKIMEMEYQNTRVKQYRLADGEYKGFRYYVLSLGTHPCAYVDVSGIPEDGIDTNWMPLPEPPEGDL